MRTIQKRLQSFSAFCTQMVLAEFILLLGLGGILMRLGMDTIAEFLAAFCLK